MSDLRNPLQRARGLGSAKDGVQHWWRQRVTAAALLVLGIWFVLLVLSLLHGGYAAAHAALAHPLNAALMIAFLIALFWHMQLGVQVVIEDYVHTRWVELTLQILVRFFAVLAALLAIIAVLRIALGG
ncbi:MULTISPECIES: succinate dehydrogenase, hydrophobic membrane anchor protein [Metallibacterium]|jgi:succinate dehydrogenase / fumarate reductase membrane anchor subunit|uniref:succinate dehydrogenase, hydrophobic membrane anchor protein n=1 Tax=Metallibacterium TaxID=1218803 RepID=UPI002616AE97|nr:MULTISPECIES: succinate dehydrogenase, hydrophobic membrane anchor protein [Metallibacterium]MBW8073843.1 succinate dehydrogenase, hydrophobic membrane anchor protein [Metallibacterium scheffleri]